MPDPRFARLRTDPRFRKPKKHTSKVVIDERFKSVLNDGGDDHRQGSSRRRVDKYGRKSSSKHDADNLRRFYQLQGVDDVHNRPDLARGEVLLESSDESTDDVDDSEVEDDGEVILGRHISNRISSSDAEYLEIDLNEDESVYAELDAQAEAFVREQEDGEQQQQEAKKTNRLAVVNLDWDHVRASHLYKIFSSLLSPLSGIPENNGASGSRMLAKTVGHGRVLNVRVCPSEFGKARMKKEEIEGPPKEIFKKSRREGHEGLLEEDEGDEYDEDALRKYQLERLRYYYAIVSCDTVGAAEHIYAELNGTELERSANVFDLSFVPDGMTFDEEFRDEATPATDVRVIDYKGLNFSTDALRHSKVNLHWDEDDPERNKVTRRVLTLGEIEEENFKALVASSSDVSSDEDKASMHSKRDRNKLRALLLDGGHEDLPEGWSGDPFRDAKTGDGDVEITFMPGLSENKVETENETTLDRYKRKMKERRLQRKREISNMGEHSATEGRFNKRSVAGDDFFGEDDNYPESAVKHDDSPQSQEEEATLGELSSTVASNGDGKESKHFSLKAILKAEKKVKKSKKSRRSTEQGVGDEELQEDFQINVQDDRFKALHEDHTFAIDPSNPNFKKTKSMVALLAERTKRQNNKHTDLNGTFTSSRDDADEKLQSLVESVKRKRSTARGWGEGKRRRV